MLLLLVSTSTWVVVTVKNRWLNACLLWIFSGFTGIDDPYEPPLNCEVFLLYP